MTQASWSDSRWISAPNPNWGVAYRPDNYFSPIFRGSFDLMELPNQVWLYVCCLGLGKVWINGKAVTDDCLTTPFTRYDKRVLYNKYEVGRLLKKGKNTVSVMLGNGMYNDVHEISWYDKAEWRAIPRFIAKLETEDNEIVFSTNSGWKWKEGPIIYNHARIGETYDARLEHENWKMPEFDDFDWNSVIIAASPGGILEENTIATPIRVVSETTAKYIGNGIYDCGNVTSGWVKITFNASYGDEFKISYAEKLKEDGSLARDNINLYNTLARERHEDIYYANGRGEEEYAPSFVYHSFRYVQITGAVLPKRVVCQTVHNDIRTIGNFECNVDILNTIHAMCTRSIKTNWMNVPTDTPGRFQGPWTGDAAITCEVTLYNFDIKSLYKKWMNDFKDCQRPSGQLPGVVPTGGWPFNGGNGPLWDSALIMIPYYTWIYENDLSLALQVWENILKYMDYLESMSENYLVKFGLEDWCSPKTHTDNGLTDTAMYYQDAMFVSRLAKAMGEEELSIYYEELSDKIKQAYQDKFLKNGIVTENTLCAMGCTLYYHLCEEKDREKIAARLVEKIKQDNFHFDCGIYGLLFVPTALSENGYADVVLKVLQNEEYPGYGYWIKNGMTTLCESWDMTLSLNHQMFAAIDNWFYKYVAGIKYEQNEIIISPCKINGIDHVIAKTRDVDIKIENDDCYITVRKAAKFRYGEQEKLLQTGEHVFQL